MKSCLLFSPIASLSTSEPFQHPRGRWIHESFPYESEATNIIYNLLFCDDLSLYRSKFEGKAEGPWRVLFATPPKASDLLALATTSSEESRLRILAFNALDQKTSATHPRELLGVVIEAGLDDGLDTLAAYKDLSARYINHSEKMIIWETSEPGVDERIRNLLAASERVVEKIGPWDKSRLPPPTKGLMRMTFLVSDGLYFGQGAMEGLQNDPLAAPVVAAATELLLELTNRATMK